MGVRLDAQTTGPGTAAARVDRLGRPRVSANGIGEGISQIGNAAYRVGKQILAEKERESEQVKSEERAVRTAKTASDFRIKWSADLEERGQAFGGQGEFSKPIYEALEKDIDDLVAAEEDPDAKRVLRQSLNASSERFKITATSVEAERRRSHAYSLVNETVELNRNSILSDPLSYQAALGDIAVLSASVPEFIREKFIKETSEAYAASYVAGLNEVDPDRLKVELADGSLDDVLSPQTKKIAVNANENLLEAREKDAKREQRAREVEAKRIARERERDQKLQNMIDGVALDRDIDDHFASLTATGLGVDDVNYERVLEIRGPVAAAKFLTQEKTAIAANQALSGFEDKSNAEIIATLSEMQPTPGQSGFAQKAKIVDAATRQATNIFKARANDPAAVVLASPAIAGLAEEAFGEDATGQSLTRYAGAVLARQAEIGIPLSRRRILTETQAKGILEAVSEGDGADYSEVISSVNAYGEKYAGQVLDQLLEAGLPPVAEALWSLSGDAVNGAILGQGIKNKKLLEKNLPSADRKRLRVSVDQKMDELFASFAGDPDAVSKVAIYGDAVALMAMERMSGGMSQSDAVKQSVDAYTRQYEFDDEYGYRIPRNIAAIHFEKVKGDAAFRPKDGGALIANGLHVLNQDIEKGALGAPGDPRIPTEQRTKNIIASYKVGGRWVNNADETGLNLVIDAGGLLVPVEDGNGQVVSVQFEDLIALSRYNSAFALPKYAGDKEFFRGTTARPDLLGGIIGSDIDFSRPTLQNEDGSFSTEETITLERDGKWYNVPTIISGERIDPEKVETSFLAKSRKVPHVGEFKTLEAAERAAELRSKKIGEVRLRDD